MIRYYITVEGRVQGVGFRFFCQSHANLMNLTGFVHNMNNGMVELQIQGSKEVIDEFISIVKKGNFFIKVKDMYTKKIPLIEKEKGFKII
ncbi:acylphosphatase [Clostridium septicum]|uniref:acylphosphatase n=1 Tax=Clostridium septicum TaxID=1504 RepID=A0A9N7PKC6_CLOSE|nr:acylphosphatase [Clostridium septicum]AYE33331.1 acylphosphatase [Clostridium septicum]MDU1314430.1 acylphosphatase [Clostridium septicum]QAS61501.1 acylphosphatase [Clostridium septicum]UEC22061.1 acylphosphatase [Clostridium septicum]USR99906.1 acylphosphatase [Clostridium septicum]